MSRWILDASLTLQWYLKDEEDREYSLAILAGLAENEVDVPFIWTYEVSNGLVMAYRRKRLLIDELSEILDSLGNLPIAVDHPERDVVMSLRSIAIDQELTVYDAAYLELALRHGLPIATQDKALRRAMARTGVALIER